LLLRGGFHLGRGRHLEGLARVRLDTQNGQSHTACAAQGLGQHLAAETGHEALTAANDVRNGWPETSETTCKGEPHLTFSSSEVVAAAGSVCWLEAVAEAVAEAPPGANNENHMVAAGLWQVTDKNCDTHMAVQCEFESLPATDRVSCRHPWMLMLLASIPANPMASALKPPRGAQV
jgi:hypothetical protein